jgi:hypothetical protein
MQPPVVTSASCRRAIVALALVISALAAANASAQVPIAATGGDATIGQQAASLPPIVRTILAEALAKEEEIKRRGPMRVTWTYAPSLCPIGEMTCGAYSPLPICLFEGGRCGAVNRDGSIAVAPRFDFVDEFHEGRALVRLGGRYGYVDLDGNAVVEPQYAIAGRYHLGYAEVDVGGKSALIDLEGRQVLAPRFARAGAFAKDVFWVNEGARRFSGWPGGEELGGLQPKHGSSQVIFVTGKWGLVDATGAWIRTPEFSDIERFDRNQTNLMWAKAATGWGLIRPDGTWLIEPKFERVGELVDDRAFVRLGGRIGYIDGTGRVAIPPKFDDGAFFAHFVDGLPAAAKLGRYWGLIDQSGEWVVEPAYDSIDARYGGGDASSDLEFKGFSARRGNEDRILDQSGKVIISGMNLWRGTSTSRTTSDGGILITFTPGQFIKFCADGRIIGFVDQKPRLYERDGTSLEPARGEMWWPLTCEPPYVLKIGEGFVYVDKWLRRLNVETFEAVGLFQDGIAAVKLGGKYGLIRADGTWAMEPSFDAAQPLPNGKALVKAGGRASLVDVATGHSVTGTTFDDVCSRGHGIVGVVRDGKIGAIDESGRRLFDPSYQAWAYNVFQDLAPARSGDKWGFVDAAGNAVEARFDEVSYFERGVSWAKSEGEWCAIDRRGNRISSLKCQSAEPHNLRRPEATTTCQIVNPAPHRWP